MEDIMVSIICTAYNHAKYIRDALDGFIKQKTDFAFEVLVHDDASTDGTADIIREYEKKYPDIIRPIYQTENQYSKGIGIVKTYLFPKVKGKYVAVCEGDDYWTDELKLQKQVNVLEAHPEIDGCAHKIEVRRASDGRIIKYKAPEKRDTVISAEKVIGGGGGFVGTNSLMYRKEIINRNYNFSSVLSFDYVTQIKISLRGGLLYLNDCMGVYRVGITDSWTSRMSKSPDKMASHLMNVIKMLETLDVETDYKYHEVIRNTVSGRKCRILAQKGDIAGFFKEPVKNCYKNLSVKDKIICLRIAVKNRGNNR